MPKVLLLYLNVINMHTSLMSVNLRVECAQLGLLSVCLKTFNVTSWIICCFFYVVSMKIRVCI